MGEELDHPKVFLNVPEEGEVVCGYCDIRFKKIDVLINNAFND